MKLATNGAVGTVGSVGAVGAVGLNLLRGFPQDYDLERILMFPKLEELTTLTSVYIANFPSTIASLLLEP
jgi:hypothetical protein